MRISEIRENEFSRLSSIRGLMSSLSSSVTIPEGFATGNPGALEPVLETTGKPANPCGYVHPDSKRSPGSWSCSTSGLLETVCSGDSATRNSEGASLGRSLGVAEFPRSGSRWPLEDADRGEEVRLAGAESAGGREVGSEADEEEGGWDPDEFPAPACAALAIACPRALRLIHQSRLGKVRGDEVK